MDGRFSDLIDVGAQTNGIEASESSLIGGLEGVTDHRNGIAGVPIVATVHVEADEVAGDDEGVIVGFQVGRDDGRSEVAARHDYEHPSKENEDRRTCRETSQRSLLPPHTNVLVLPQSKLARDGR